MKKGIYSRWFPFAIALTLLCNVGVILIPSCKSSSERGSTQEQKDNQEDLIKTNKNIMQDESADIENYVKRLNYQVTTSATGLRYMIYEKGAGVKNVANDDVVKLNYKVSLLDGTLVYSSDSTGALEFQVGKSEIATGLQEGVKYLHEGDKAIFILPSHLAYGLTGDGDQIKYRESLVIDAQLLTITSPKK